MKIRVLGGAPVVSGSIIIVGGAPYPNFWCLTLTVPRGAPRRRVEPAGHAFHAVHEKPKLEAMASMKPGDGQKGI